MVLLIACANVAGLLIARGTRRRQEIAIRLAIGGTRSRLVQQFLVEGFWLALIGTIAGLGLSMAFMKLVNSLTLPIPIPMELHLGARPSDVRGRGGAGIPVDRVVRRAAGPQRDAPEPRAGTEARGAVRATRRFTARSMLLTGQVTVSTVLLVTAFLFIRNLARTQVTDPGFEVNRALVAQLGFVRGLPGEDHIGVVQRATERVAALPGIEQAAFASSVPLTMHGGSTNGLTAHIDGADGSQHVEFARNYVGPGYFSTLNVRQTSGREFLASDVPGAPPVVVINDEFARRYFNGRNPVGNRIRFEGRDIDVRNRGRRGQRQTRDARRGPARCDVPAAPAEPGGLDIAFVRGAHTRRPDRLRGHRSRRHQ